MLALFILVYKKIYYGENYFKSRIKDTNTIFVFHLQYILHFSMSILKLILVLYVQISNLATHTKYRIHITLNLWLCASYLFPSFDPQICPSTYQLFPPDISYLPPDMCCAPPRSTPAFHNAKRQKLDLIEENLD